ncbi:hypothetical protein AB833_32605 [Chromatiales bacterium (ex Bugula neritina AB1)]|nr:hypothetical protein AB833_32605 [Chromatiales bacterium (ex Bugula neritina AB1)]
MREAIKSSARRSFCKAALAAGSALIPELSAARLREGSELLPHQAFASSFEQVPEFYGPTEVKFDRPLPEALQGTLYRNGPARMQRGETRYHHWFDGDGMVHSFSLQGNALVHRAKIVKTERYLEETRAGRFLRDGFGTGFTDSLAVLKPDDLNVANISVLPLDDEVLALWEAGSPWQLDADTLETLGRKVFSPETDRLPFSAHPRIDPQGRIWNFGYLSGSGKLVLYDLEPDGELRRVSVIDAPNADMVHDFAITKRYLVFVLQPLHLQPGNAPSIPFYERLHWEDGAPVHILVVDKQNLQVAHRFEVPAFFAFHMGNAWEDGSAIHIEVATGESFKPLMETIRQATRALPLSTPQAEPATIEIVLDTINHRAAVTRLPGSGVDFPRFDQRFTGLPTQQLFMMGRSPQMSDGVFGFNRVCAIDRSSESEKIYDYNAETLAEEHIFVPAPGFDQGKGWLVGTRYNWRCGRTSVSVFDAQHIDDGPLAECHLPYSLPLGLHGQFVPA